MNYDNKKTPSAKRIFNISSTCVQHIFKIASYLQQPTPQCHAGPLPQAASWSEPCRGPCFPCETWNGSYCKPREKWRTPSVASEFHFAWASAASLLWRRRNISIGVKASKHQSLKVSILNLQQDGPIFCYSGPFQRLSDASLKSPVICPCLS